MLSNLGKAAFAKKQTQKYKDDEIRQGSPTPALAQKVGAFPRNMAGIVSASWLH